MNEQYQQPVVEVEENVIQNTGNYDLIKDQ